MPEHILVVDDEPYIRLTLTAILERAGYSVEDACSAQVALEKIQIGRFDGMVIDLKMPDMDGLALLDQVRQLAPNLPVIILTAHASVDSAVTALRLRANEYLYKPVDPQFFLSSLARVLDESRKKQKQESILVQMRSLMTQIDSQEAANAGAPSQLTTEPGPSALPEHLLVRGPLSLDLRAQIAFWNGELLSLSPLGFAYLRVLARNAPTPVSTEEMVQAAQGYQVERYQAAELARWHIYQLRQVIEPSPRNPQYILTVRQVGYRLAIE